jgi:Nucleotidyltransferase domain
MIDVHQDPPMDRPPEDGIEQFERTIGAEIPDLLALEGLPRNATDSVYASGSVVEGFGNSRSDIDIFVVGDGRPCDSGVLIEKEQFTISIHFLGKRRVDFEYWPVEQIHVIAARLNCIHVGDDFVADKLAPVEKLFIHRLKVAIPLCNPIQLSNLKSRFDWQRFQGYLVQEATHRIDGAIEDVWGMMETGRLLDATLRARDIAGFAADAGRFAQGETNPLEKWRAAALTRLSQRRGAAMAELMNTFVSLEFPSPPPVLFSGHEVEKYVRRCIEFADAVVRDVQG